jgi:NDP-sugar pyrophosphorylase family protein
MMKAGIIAAGEGSRLKSEGIALPKPLVPVNGVPLINRLITSFASNGISEVVCIINEYSLDVQHVVEESSLPIPVKFVVQTTPSSMHSLFVLSPYLMEGQFLLSTVDSVFHEKEFNGFLRHAQQNHSVDGILAVTNFIDDENPLYVEMDANQRITQFSKSEKTSWVTGGLYIFHPRIFREKEAVLSRGIERLRNFLGHLVVNGYSITGYPFSKIVDVDHVSDIRTAEQLLKQTGIA